MYGTVMIVLFLLFFRLFVRFVVPLLLLRLLLFLAFLCFKAGGGIWFESEFIFVGALMPSGFTDRQ